MLFALERLVLQGTARHPQYCWTLYGHCANKELLERIRQSQHCPKEWRVRPCVENVGQAPRAA
ncbi:hypothetical protein [Hungatella hathewayi]|uniref:hypothetical protein n=1 Tax=Hungatella hathewayi TaxID=154046 RepID=UPI0011DCA3C7|nr:hypothetical protein [Hungatella hathewayi]